MLSFLIELIKLIHLIQEEGFLLELTGLKVADLTRLADITAAADITRTADEKAKALLETLSEIAVSIKKYTDGQEISDLIEVINDSADTDGQEIPDLKEVNGSAILLHKRCTEALELLPLSQASECSESESSNSVV